MPNFTGAVDEGQIVELVAYIKSLSTDQDAERRTNRREASNDRHNTAIRAPAHAGARAISMKATPSCRG